MKKENRKKMGTLNPIVFKFCIENNIILSNKQKNILRNTLAWYETVRDGKLLTYINDFVLPKKEEIISLFNYIDKGIDGVKKDYPDIFIAWCCHYTDPMKAVTNYIDGKIKNPPVSPPSAWLYEYLYTNHYGNFLERLLLDCFFDCEKDIYENGEFRKPTKQKIIDKWERGLPIYQKIERFYRFFSLKQEISLQGNY